MRWLVKIFEWVRLVFSAWKRAGRNLERDQAKTKKEQMDARNAEAKKKLEEAFKKGVPDENPDDRVGD